MPAATYDLDKTTVREVILERLEALDISWYEFAMACEGQAIPYTSTYRFLNGSSDTFVDNVEKMMRYLGVDLGGRARRQDDTLRTKILAASTKAKKAKKRRQGKKV